MKLTIDQRDVAIVPQDGETLDSLLTGLRARAEIPATRVIASLEVDGSRWAADHIEAAAHTMLDDLAEVHIRTDDLQGYARRILTDAGGMLGVLQAATLRLADEFRADEPKQANADLLNLLNALQHFLACLYHVRNTYASELPDPDPMQPVVERVSRCLDVIQASQERRDWTALAGQLELDLLPSFRGFESLLEGMKDEI
jgi:hypothetical protein